ncbi:prenyltransferase, putative [Talaromyces stipitatus ATCC 10500]|uniref:Prenyltransferase, putative n=1 Tax=Talaromyces stipitatus (strain ATCC 10500 / CBS 375.48 / QM 6759 / NRRL 1006) TaxID=441959 RepID=B8MSH5_TALSN|nr:prenyltransferase, putative [Talaromyces stipitatus ATCC 10500]EED12003.1 prenyltransferase, putative [Talaromyces stipitatus ATCC 10500]
MAATTDFHASSLMETTNTGSQTSRVARSMTANGSGVDQYGGNHKPTALSNLPDSWIPYIQLARLFPPAGLFLIYFPHAFGILHAAIRTGAPSATLLYASTIMFVGSFFFSNAAHTWNDLIDAELDAKVERTYKRPIPRGAISPRAAFLFTVTQAMGATWFLSYLPGGFQQGFLYALPNILATIYYPWAKRHTHFSQFVLGLCLAWVPAGFWSLDWAQERLSFPFFYITLEPSVMALFLAGVVWTVIYDTIYAHQDLQADLRVGIKSLAVLFQTRTKFVLWPLLALMASLLVSCGQRSHFGAVFYLVGVGGAIGALGAMIALVELRDSQSCWWWFSKAFWLAGGAIFAGLLGEYLM